MQFPQTRLRRLRQSAWLRSLVAENTLQASDLIQPLFIHDQDGDEPIDALPGVSRLSIESAVAEAKRAASLGIPAIALFPVVDASLKTPNGDEATNPGNLICRAVRAIKAEVENIGIICDVALDPYTEHGHDGVLGEGGDVDNDATVEILTQQAVVLAKAGADIVAPSDMMDGRVGAIRAALDEHKHENVAILSYAAKYASAFYGPFRDAIGSNKAQPIDKSTYQMNPANGDEALREVEQDMAEGADMVMVKPGLPYLDVIARVRDGFNVPVLAYQVSGEYAMIHAAAQNGAFDKDAAMLESLLAFKRAGATAILTYAACDIGQKLEKN